MHEQFVYDTTVQSSHLLRCCRSSMKYKIYLFFMSICSVFTRHDAQLYMHTITRADDENHMTASEPIN